MVTPSLPPNALRLAWIYTDGTTMPAIAEQEGISLNTVCTQIKTLRKRLTLAGYDVSNVIRLRRVLHANYDPPRQRSTYIALDDA